MKLAGLAQIISSAMDSIRNFLVPIPSILMLCTCNRRPGFSSILASAKVYAGMNQNDNDEIVKKFVLNVIDKIKSNLQDDGVCFVIIPPGELQFQLYGSNAGGPIVMTQDARNSETLPSNPNFVFAYGIIR